MTTALHRPDKYGRCIGCGFYLYWDKRAKMWRPYGS